MWPIMTPEAETVTELGVESLIDPGEGPNTESETRLTIERGAGPTKELRAGPVMEPGAKPAETKESLVTITSITIINVSSSGLHELIRTYSDEKKATHHSKPLRKTLF